jgi:hypothetical protein
MSGRYSRDKGNRTERAELIGARPLVVLRLEDAAAIVAHAEKPRGRL